AAGNIGRALSEVALATKRPDWAVVEASSFQLAEIEAFAPHIGAITNLSPDHLDRYPSVDAYYADKARLFDNASPASIWILNGEQIEVLELASDAPGRRLLVQATAASPQAEGGWVTEGGELRLRLDGREVALVRAEELKLLGRHNQVNALFASLAALSAGAAVEAVRDGLRSFPPLTHRLEPIAELGGALWINDSKATNIESTRVALDSMTRPTVLLLGGRHKGEPYTGLLPEIGAHVKAVVAYGEAAPIVESDLRQYVRVERVEGAFDAALDRASALASRGDAVLLSPACSSYDMFRDYEERGETFRGWVAERRNRAGAARAGDAS
ncbi:MAG: UDP-N-acetylmuramoyl-L-alanine--D-glutamate ligase, partial [Longimicrobiales bacterium]